MQAATVDILDNLLLFHNSWLYSIAKRNFFEWLEELSFHILVDNLEC